MMPPNLNIITLFFIPERITHTQFFASLSSFTLGNWFPSPELRFPWVPSPVHPSFDPIDASIRFDLHQLYVLVLSMGGYHIVERTGRWILVAIYMKIWHDDPKVPRDIYRRYLLHYELYACRVRRLFAARKRFDRDPGEYSQQACHRVQERNDMEDYHVACRHWSSIETRKNIKMQGVLDGSPLVMDYSTISPAIEFYVAQKTLTESTNLIDTYVSIGKLQSPKSSVGPMSSISKDGELWEENDNFLSKKARRIKQMIISRNRAHILETHIKRKQQPLPVVTSEELAKFIYDEVDSDTEEEESDGESETYGEMDEDQIQLIEKFGFNYPSRNTKPSRKKSQGEFEENGVSFTDYLMMCNPTATPAAGSPDWRKELVTKYGFKPRVYALEPSIKAVIKGPNFEEYMESHNYDHNHPEIKRFFDERIRREGGFWQMELDRLDALERRIRGDDEREALAGHKYTPWDQTSVDSMIIPGQCHSEETTETSDSEGPEPFRLISPPPGFEKAPISMNDYARRIAEHHHPVTLHWGETFGSSKRNIEQQKKSAIFEQDYAEDFEQAYVEDLEQEGLALPFENERQETFSYSSGEYDRLCAQYNHQMTVDDLVELKSVYKPVTVQNHDHEIELIKLSSLNISNSPTTQPNKTGPRHIPNLPTSHKIDITKFNPSNPPSFNYTQEWLQTRAIAEDEKGEIQVQEMNRLEHYEGSRGSRDYEISNENGWSEDYRGIRTSRFGEHLGSCGNNLNSQRRRLSQAPGSPGRSNPIHTHSPGNPQGSRIAYIPGELNRQQNLQDTPSNAFENRQIRLTASEDLLLCSTFQSYQIQESIN